LVVVTLPHHFLIVRTSASYAAGTVICTTRIRTAADAPGLSIRTNTHPQAKPSLYDSIMIVPLNTRRVLVRNRREVERRNWLHLVKKERRQPHTSPKSEISAFSEESISTFRACESCIPHQTPLNSVRFRPFPP
jgi:hypothetical protein